VPVAIVADTVVIGAPSKIDHELDGQPDPRATIASAGVFLTAPSSPAPPGSACAMLGRRLCRQYAAADDGQHHRRQVAVEPQAFATL
jgi:hypothetical protein